MSGTAALRRPPVRSDVVDEHFEELDFLWEQRSALVFAPDWTLDELAELEERADAHLDGLHLAERYGVDVARAQLTSGEGAAATAAALVLLGAGLRDIECEVVDALCAAEEPPTRDRLRDGLRHAPLSADLERDLVELAAQAAEPTRAAALDVLAFHRCAAPGVEPLQDAEDPAARVLAWEATGRLARSCDPQRLDHTLRTDAPAVQRAALAAAARCAFPGLEAVCLRAFESDGSTEALAFLGVLANDASTDVLVAALADAALSDAALRGLGAGGDVRALPHIISALADPERAAAAAAAFVRITGVEDLPVREAEAPEEGAPAQAEDEQEAALPDVDANAVQALWQQMAGRFAPQRRWQCGLPVDPPTPDADGATGAPSAPSQLRPAALLPEGLSLEARRDLYLRLRSRHGRAIADIELEARARAQRAAPVLTPPRR